MIVRINLFEITNANMYESRNCFMNNFYFYFTKARAGMFNHEMMIL